MVRILDFFLYMLSVVFFICGMLSLAFCAWPLFIMFGFLFSFCYYAVRYDGPKPKHLVLHIVEGGNDDESEPEPEKYKPYNRANFNFN
jgi:hypothetical protein